MIYSITCFCQTPNTDLYQTWYLYYTYSSDDNILYPISAITPPISPYVTFTETSDFHGEGACNSFSGTFSFELGDVLSFNNFASTELVCSSSEQNLFEQGFFYFMHYGGQYSISGQGNDMILGISTPIFQNYVFGNSPLHLPKFDLKQTVVYPNPVDSKLFVHSQNNLINKIEIINSLGQTVKTITTDFDVIDISDFISGIYFMKLYSGDKSVSKKIIKK